MRESVSALLEREEFEVLRRLERRDNVVRAARVPTPRKEPQATHLFELRGRLVEVASHIKDVIEKHHTTLELGAIEAERPRRARLGR
jgi:hypothetical protein